MNKYIIWSILLMTLFSVVSCDKEFNSPVFTQQEEKEVKVVIRDQEMNFSRTADFLQRQLEEFLASTVEIYVFNSSNKLEYKNTKLSIADTTSEVFSLTVGKKYVYIFSNRLTSLKGFIEPDLGADRFNFETQVIVTDIVNNVPDKLVNSDTFFIQTLWKQVVNVTSDEIGDPQVLNIEVGRTVSKVNLTGIDKGAGSSLKGNFINPKYRVGSVPTEYYLVGQYEGSSLPIDLNVQHISAVHTVMPEVEGGGNSVFKDYSWPSDGNIGTSFHIIENTSQYDEAENIYYGNTTYIHLETVYEPTAEEILNPTTMLQSNTWTGGTFYAGEYEGQTYMFDTYDDKDGLIENLREYRNGKMYYHFAIRNKNGIGLDKTCCVLRNNFYQIKVVSILNLGDPTDRVDPFEPIPEKDIDIEVEIDVIDWHELNKGNMLY